MTVSPLSELALFAGCSAEEIERMATAVVGVREVPDGETICREGDTAQCWWVVAEGTAEVTIGGLYVGTIGPGESIGELALLDGQPRNATVTASSDMVLHEVDGARSVDVLVESPVLMLALLREMAVRLRDADEHTARPLSPSPAYEPTPTRVAAAGEPVVFNPFAPGFASDPYRHYAALRRADPVHLDRLTGAYILTRYADVHRLARDRTLAVGVGHATRTAVVDAEMARDEAGGGVNHRMMLRVDGDDHARLRQLLARVFTPKAVSAWRRRAEAVVERLLTSCAGRDELDVVGDFALLFPAQVISEMLGMPADDVTLLRDWSLAMTKTFDPLNSPHEEEASTEATRQMTAYVEGVVTDKRARGDSDILSDLIEARDGSARLSTDELVAQVILLYVAGHENALNLVANGLVHLFEFPDQLQRMRTDPFLDTNAIEEITRFDSPVQFARRVTTAQVEIGSEKVPAGALLLLGLGAANRDPEKWGDGADVLDLSRPRANEHASFGGGPHHCLGSALARLEAQVALPRLVRRFPEMAPAYDTPPWHARLMLRGVERLPVTL
jgi:cytochrome P450